MYKRPSRVWALISAQMSGGLCDLITHHLYDFSQSVFINDCRYDPFKCFHRFTFKNYAPYLPLHESAHSATTISAHHVRDPYPRARVQVLAGKGPGSSFWTHGNTRALPYRFVTNLSLTRMSLSLTPSTSATATPLPSSTSFSGMHTNSKKSVSRFSCPVVLLMKFLLHSRLTGLPGIMLAVSSMMSR